ncbi:DUF2513 domain-containing protein [Megasphaera sueciensis]|uniref:DUF2513 domain-containing protein n=1 Tax=Megasphaera sueciensis TaxID=349094 RepID=UPI003D05A829
MQINIDLLRDILIDVSDCPTPTVRSNRSFTYPEIPQGMIDYHIHILMDAHYLKGLDASSKLNPYQYLELELTLAGQSFLDSVKNDTVWAKTKDYLKEHAIEFSFNAVSVIAAKFTSG